MNRGSKGIGDRWQTTSYKLEMGTQALHEHFRKINKQNSLGDSEMNYQVRGSPPVIMILMIQAMEPAWRLNTDTLLNPVPAQDLNA